MGIKRAFSLAGVLAVAVATLVTGAQVLLTYQLTPGTETHAHGQWPVASKFVRDFNSSTIVLFAHPECSCTEATLGELERILAHVQRTPFVHAVLVGNEGEGNGALKMHLKSITSVRVSTDPDGKEARIFRAKTSGEIFAYNRSGVLIFHGGITSARGHAGGNRAEDRLLAALVTEAPAGSAERVFGCSLLNESAPSAVRFE